MASSESLNKSMAMATQYGDDDFAALEHCPHVAQINESEATNCKELGSQVLFEWSDSFETFMAPCGIELGSDSVENWTRMPTDQTMIFETPPLWTVLTGAINFGQSVSVSNMGTLAIIGGMGWYPTSLSTFCGEWTRKAERRAIVSWWEIANGAAAHTRDPPRAARPRGVDRRGSPGGAHVVLRVAQVC